MQVKIVAGFHSVSKGQNFVMLGLLLITILYLLTTIVCTMGARKSVFTRKFMDEFNREHQTHFGPDSKTPNYGYPDCGNGYYSERLSYKDWMIMNNGQRAQGNFAEQMFFYIVTVFVTGCWDYRWAFGISMAIFVGRFFFAWGYMKGGPNSRIVGALINDIALLVSLATSVVAI